MTATETGAEAQAPPGVFSKSITGGQRLRAILGGSSGNLVEWYDWFVYSAFAVYFAKHFFARPVGAWLMGLYADRAGRRTALTVAVGMMCLGSFIIAVLPGYETIGVAAPVLLVVARLLQGLSVGGEYGASATYLSEMAGKQRRGFWSSFQFVTMVMGQLMALGILALLQSTLSRPELEAWGWRIPFFIGALMAVVVFWIRSRLEESTSYENAKASGAERARTMMLFLRYPKETLAIFGFTAGGSVAFYTYTTYMPKFLVGSAGFAPATATAISAASLVLYLISLPIYGWISDNIGRKPTLGLAFGGGALVTYPLMTSILNSGGDAMAAFLMVSALVVILSGYNSISAVVKAELFPTNVRALGVALPYGMATATFGGTAEMLALWFKRQGMETGFFVYVSVVMAISFLIVFRLRETRTHSLILED